MQFELERDGTAGEIFFFDLNKSRVVVLIKLLNPALDNLQHLINYLEQSEFAQDVAILSLDQVVVLKTWQNSTVLSAQMKTLLPADYSKQDYKIAVGACLNLPLLSSFPCLFKVRKARFLMD